MPTRPIQISGDWIDENWWNSYEKKYPILDKRWCGWENNGHRFFAFEYPLVTDGKKDPLYNNLDPWFRPIREWTYYTDDHPLIWQSREQEHPSRNSMFFPKCPVTATHYAYTSIDNVWFNLYLIQPI